MVPRPLTGGGGKIAITASPMPANFFCRLLRNRKAGQAGSITLVKWLERFENDAGRWAVDEAIDGKAGKRHRAFHARLLERDVGHLPDHLLGAVQVAPSGSCAKLTRYCLSCSGTKPGGTA